MESGCPIFWAGFFEELEIFWGRGFPFSQEESCKYVSVE